MRKGGQQYVGNEWHTGQYTPAAQSTASSSRRVTVWRPYCVPQNSKQSSDCIAHLMLHTPLPRCIHGLSVPASDLNGAPAAGRDMPSLLHWLELSARWAEAVCQCVFFLRRTTEHHTFIVRAKPASRINKIHSSVGLAHLCLDELDSPAVGLSSNIIWSCTCSGNSTEVATVNQTAHADPKAVEAVTEMAHSRRSWTRVGAPFPSQHQAP